MKVTRDVIADLLPAYASGEATEDTRRLVDEYLQGDSEFARVVEDSVRESLPLGGLPPLCEELELRTLRKTKRLFRAREASFWLALAFTLSPLTVYDTAWGSGWVLVDHPLLAGCLFALAATGWFVHFMLRRRLRSTNL